MDSIKKIYTKVQKIFSVKIHNFCYSGASISKCPWLTWADFVIQTFKPSMIVNHTCKGAGNDYICNSGLNALHGIEHACLCVMLTNFDKFDMWVTGDRCRMLANEKHAPHWIDGSPAIDRGFWCTGSHFPLSKATYLKDFFDIDHSAALQMQQVIALSKYCDDHDIPLIILLDSPILSITETEINDIIRNHRDWSERLRWPEHSLVGLWIDLFKSLLVDQRGLIGYCIDNDLPWYNKKYGPHPPSISHWHYFKDKILPWIKISFPDIELHRIDQEFVNMADWMTDKWRKNGF